MIDRRILLIGSLAVTLIGSAVTGNAQQSNNRLLGVIEKLEGKKLTLKPADDNEIDLQIADDVFVARNEPSSLAAIKPGDYVASAAVKKADGKLHSVEMRIFPKAMYGLGEGQHPMQDTDKTMTNATVSEVVAVPDGQLLKVTFEGKTSELVVEPTVPVIAIVVASVDDLKVGTNISVGTAKAADGTLIAKRISVQ